MSHTIVALIVVAAVILICLLLVGLHNKQKHKAMNELLNFFREAGTQNHFIFSGEEVLQNCVLGIDGVQRKMLIVTRDANFYHSAIVDIDDIKTCSVKKLYASIHPGDLKKQGLEQYLNKIVLCLALRGDHTIEIIFYNHSDNHMHAIPELEQKARHWKTFLTKMQKPFKKTAR